VTATTAAIFFALDGDRGGRCRAGKEASVMLAVSELLSAAARDWAGAHSELRWWWQWRWTERGGSQPSVLQYALAALLLLVLVV